MSPTFKGVAKEMQSNNLEFREIDVEEAEGVDLSTKYQERNVPTILVVKADRVVERIVGTRSKSQIKEVLDKWN